MIRPARMSDLDALAALLLNAHAKSASVAIAVDVQRARTTLSECIVHRGIFSWVSEGVGAAMFGMLDQPWYSRDLVASDIFCYAQDGNGANLIRRFIGWAIERGAVQVVLEQSSGIDPERVGRLYDRLGLERVGSVHTRVLR